MTTVSWSSIYDDSTDAAFRVLGTEIKTNLAAAGLVQTADTGQINWVTATRPAVNTAAGYEIWRLPDSSLFFKIEYGSSASAITTPQFWMTVGQGSNGSGTLTGQLSTRSSWSTNQAQSGWGSAIPFTSYISVTNNALMIAWKIHTNNTQGPAALIVVGKSVDSAGASNTDGFGVLYLNQSIVNFQSVRLIATAATLASSAFFALTPGNPASTLIGSNAQVYHVWMNIPEMRPFPWAVVYKPTELATHLTFPATMVAAVSHTYICIGILAAGTVITGTGSNAWMLALIFE